jgi:hypothetical protein
MQVSLALRAAHDHTSGFEDGPLRAAVCRLQRLLGPLGWAGCSRDGIHARHAWEIPSTVSAMLSPRGGRWPGVFDPPCCPVPSAAGKLSRTAIASIPRAQAARRCSRRWAIRHRESRLRSDRWLAVARGASDSAATALPDRARSRAPSVLLPCSYEDLCATRFSTAFATVTASARKPHAEGRRADGRRSTRPEYSAAAPALAPTERDTAASASDDAS